MEDKSSFQTKIIYNNDGRAPDSREVTQRDGEKE
jgi:hypothetical protein